MSLNPKLIIKKTLPPQIMKLNCSIQFSFHHSCFSYHSSCTFLRAATWCSGLEELRNIYFLTQGFGVVFFFPVDIKLPGWNDPLDPSSKTLSLDQTLIAEYSLYFLNFQDQNLCQRRVKHCRTLPGNFYSHQKPVSYRHFFSVSFLNNCIPPQ